MKRGCSPSTTDSPKKKRGVVKHDLHAHKALSGPEIIDLDNIGEAPGNPKVGLSFVNLKPHYGTPAYSPLDVEPWSYDPASQSLPKSSVPYSFLAHAFVTLSQNRSRIQILDVLTNTLRTIINHHCDSLLPSLYLLSNSIAPAYTPVELGLGSSIISRAIQNISGLSAASIKRLYNSKGDPGDVAFEAKSNLRVLIPHPPLLVTFVYQCLLKIASCRGQGAAKQKEKIVERLLVAATGEETRYLTRTLCQNLRVGAVRTSILTALARSMVMTPLSVLNVPCVGETLHTTANQVLDNANQGQEEAQLMDKFKKAENLIKRIFVQHPNFDHIAVALLQGGLPGLSDQVPLTIGIPLHPTLGSPVRSLREVYDILGDFSFSAEYKYDGQRAQIHASKEDAKASIKMFSRHLEDMTTKYPDVTSLVEAIFTERPHIHSFIIDSEIVAIDPLTGELKSFQELSNRARKDVELREVRVSVCVFAFDLMYYNGEVLLENTFRERRALLHSQFPPFKPDVEGAARFDHVKSCASTEGESAVQHFWKDAVESRCEGLMIKLLDGGEIAKDNGEKRKSRRKPLPATYEPDKRTTAWLKLKKDYVAGIGDTLDLIPIGAWHGNGRKVQWWSPILLALWDPGKGRPVAVCKCMSGFTDSFYKALAEQYSTTNDGANCSSQPVWECDTEGYRPDVYFRPHEVWEIRGADITISPVSAAARGLIDARKGLSVRFPRFIRRREDKDIENASTPTFLGKLWKSQQSTNGKDKVNNDDFIDVDVMTQSDLEEDGIRSD